MPSGLYMREHYIQMLQGKYDCAQTTELAFFAVMHRSLVEGVFRGRDAARMRALQEVSLRAADYLYFGPPYQRVPERWSNGELRAGPTPQIAIAPRAADGGESAELPYCYAERWGPGYLPPDGRVADLVETMYAFEVLTLADLWARELGVPDAERFLRRALDLDAGAKRHAEVVARMRREENGSDLAPSGSRAGYLARVEALVGAE